MAAAVAAVVAVRKVKDMNILEKLGLKSVSKDRPDPDTPKEPNANPHDNGGCCGGCGGTQEKEE